MNAVFPGPIWGPNLQAFLDSEARTAGVPLADFLATPMEQFRMALNACIKYASECDSSRDPLAPA